MINWLLQVGACLLFLRFPPLSHNIQSIDDISAVRFTSMHAIVASHRNYFRFHSSTFLNGGAVIFLSGFHLVPKYPLSVDFVYSYW